MPYYVYPFKHVKYKRAVINQSVTNLFNN